MVHWRVVVSDCVRFGNRNSRLRKAGNQPIWKLAVGQGDMLPIFSFPGIMRVSVQCFRFFTMAKLARADLTNAKGVLIDLTKCMGCGSCVVACKKHNKNEWVEHRAPATGEDARLADANWTVVQKHRLARPDGGEAWRFVKRQCMHCKDPACVSSCFATAFKKTEAGPVEYYPNLCVGCRYCMLACPFSVPKFEWDNPLPMLTKCSMCGDRIAHGDEPACITVCPTNVMTFGKYDDILAEAKRRLTSDSRYIQHIYGEEEAGGTLWMYISDKPFEELGFKMNVPLRSIPANTSGFMKATPTVGIIWATILAVLYIITRPRRVAAKKKEETVEKPEHR